MVMIRKRTWEIRTAQRERKRHQEFAELGLIRLGLFMIQEMAVDEDEPAHPEPDNRPDH